MAGLVEAEWFDLENYRELRNWTLVDWLTAVSARIAVGNLIDYGLATNWEIGGELKLLNEHFADLPLNPIRGGAPFWLGGSRTNIWKLHYSPDEDWAVSPVNEVFGNVDVPSRKWSGFSILEVDVTAPDQVLISAFEAWLKATKETRQRVSSVSDADISSWIACHAIPFIDLQQFLRLTKQRVSQARIADLLFSEAQVDRVERLRKVTARAANRLLSMPLYRALSAQVGHERAEPSLLDLGMNDTGTKSDPESSR